jgi:ribosomal protein S18 acetylase RimI-like enzyme
MTDSYANRAARDTPDRPAPTIRRASLADAGTIAEFGARTFSDTFAHLYPPEDLAGFLAAAHSVERARADIADPAKALWLVEAQGVAIGYALAGPCKLPHPEVSPTCGELDRIYIDAAHHGGGLGSRLLDETLAWLEQDGPRRLWIGVWSENLGAQKLYARRGFEVVGTYEFAVGRVLDHEFIMRRG